MVQRVRLVRFFSFRHELLLYERFDRQLLRDEAEIGQPKGAASFDRLEN